MCPLWVKNGLPPFHTGDIDQLNAVIAGQLKSIGGGNNNYTHGH